MVRGKIVHMERCFVVKNKMDSRRQIRVNKYNIMYPRYMRNLRTLIFVKNKNNVIGVDMKTDLSLFDKLRLQNLSYV